MYQIVIPCFVSENATRMVQRMLRAVVMLWSSGRGKGGRVIAAFSSWHFL